jgi:lipoprotein NlpD
MRGRRRPVILIKKRLRTMQWLRLSHPARVGSVLVLGTLLVACTASWQAPVESRNRAPSAPKAAGSLAAAERYRVQRGDTLYGIAWQKGVDYRSIATWNSIPPPYRIYVGQTLRLAPPPARPNPGTARQAPTKQPQAKRPTQTTRVAGAPPPTERAPEPAASRSVERTNLRWVWPAEGRIVAGFDASQPLGKGIKISGKRGARVNAAEGGKVVYSGSGLIGYGQLIIVKHNDNYLSAYGHNKAILVREGQEVARGQKIAEMGTAGDGKPLLHFEIRRKGQPVNPTRYLPSR